MTTLLPNTAPDAPTAEDVDRLAFASTAATRSAMKAADSPPFSLDAFFAVGKALWIAPRVRVYRDRMLALPEYAIQHLDRLEEYACALRFVQTEILRRIQRARQLPVIAAEGWRMRSLLMSYAEALSYKGKIAPELIVRLREGSGYRDLVEDLTVLVREFLTLPAIHTDPGAAVTREDLTRASEIAQQIHVHVGNGVDADMSQATLLEERRKLGGLLVEAHSEVRRAVTYFRWKEDDAATLVPSLRVPPGARKAPEVASEAPADLAALHEQLHAAQDVAPAPSHPDDSPFVAE